MIRNILLGVAIVALIGCNAIQPSPDGQTVFQPTFPSPAPIPVPAGPHFALEILAPTGPLYDGDPWNGVVSVSVNTNIIRPEMPQRVMVTGCASSAQTYEFGVGTVRLACWLQVGVHRIEAVAEMADGRRYSTAVNATVLRR